MEGAKGGRDEIGQSIQRLFAVVQAMERDHRRAMLEQELAFLVGALAARSRAASGVSVTPVGASVKVHRSPVDRP